MQADDGERREAANVIRSLVMNIEVMPREGRENWNWGVLSDRGYRNSGINREQAGTNGKTLKVQALGGAKREVERSAF
ncbi:hypothetical protein KYK30_20360 [Shinella yambaruensis]|uniref:Uncharacterized protein n=1 Tax=Shinella yambaruensis TaxID=415996 RepID=A0ABQ5ZGT6_9HYPH|nr:hypothetical protein [Shinella yambaruensis]MCJ8027053.1 hypothetical protein [Shinella yambaruensis]MCU7982056.1 hypothetical protein [Shinella yambaruensis]GLR51231.1 hypothetical protein GCM10007923_24390 [Shinella yambaruensis]